MMHFVTLFLSGMHACVLFEVLMVASLSGRSCELMLASSFTVYMSSPDLLLSYLSQSQSPGPGPKDAATS